MPRPRTLLAVSCPKHGAGPCPRPSGCPERRALAGLPPLPPSSGTTGAERARRAGPVRDLERGLSLVEGAVDDLSPEQCASAVPRVRAVGRELTKRAKLAKGTL